MEVINLNSLTAEQKERLMMQLEADKKAKDDALKAQRQTYEQIKDSQVKATFHDLTNISSLLENAKRKVFSDFSTVLELKKELFTLSDEQMLTQQSHTFTTIDGDQSIIVGQHVVDGWDETLDVGIKKVNEWLESQMREGTEALIGIIRDLLKPDKKGILKASRVLDLSKQANELGDKKLIEAVNLIRDAYRPKRTSTYVKAKFRDSEGREMWLGLSMSSV